MMRFQSPLVAPVFAALLSLGALAAPSAHAEEIRTLDASLTEDPDSEGAWLLKADFDIGLTPKLEEAVSRGVILTFAVDFELIRPRWYWWNEKVISTSQAWRLSYHALTRQYRLSLDGLQLRFATLNQALQALALNRGWRVVSSDTLNPGQSYEARVRMRLDTSLLPKPIQVNALTSNDWSLSSNWHPFKFAAPAKNSSPAPAPAETANSSDHSHSSESAR
ncbi:MAG: DUF4390 domain-containing protein [Burkholderiaceae bacterium]|nr:MAG: DUF4390 domain-containing protein [Burkholderiaceae bacterium]